MVRTQIQLEEAEFERLRDVARGLNRSVADCVREGISLFLQQCSSEDDFSDIAGRFRPLKRAPETLEDRIADSIWASKHDGEAP